MSGGAGSWLKPLQAVAFTAWGTGVTWLEVAAFVLALAMVVCNMRVHPLAWPLAIGSSLLYGVLFWSHRLYGEAGLQLFFVGMAGWGWWQWVRGTAADGSMLAVRTLRPAERWRVVAAVAVAWPAAGLFLRTFTDTDVPWWDAFPTAASIVGTWLLGRKYLENWAVWVVVNTVSVGLFVHKQLWLTVLLYALFVAMSVAGWRTWACRLAPGSPVR